MAKEKKGSWYRVVDRPLSGVGPFLPIGLHPEDGAGRDLVILVALGEASAWGLDSLHCITPEQRGAWQQNVPFWRLTTDD